MADVSNRVGVDRRTIEEPRIVELLMLRGWPIELRQGLEGDARQGASAALAGLIALGLPFDRTQRGERRFDPVEVTNFLVWASLNRGDPTFERRYVSSARRLVFEAHGSGVGDGAAPDCQLLGPVRFGVTLRRRFNLAGSRPGRRIRLRLPVPLEDAAQTDMQVRFLPPGPGEVETSTAPGQLNMLVGPHPDGEITAGIRVTFTSRPGPRPAQPGALPSAEAELYTRPVEGLIRVTDRIQALADRLAGTERDTARVLERFWTFALNEFCSGAIHYDLISPAEPLETVLDSGLFDCRLGSALLIALCRARGIPARMVHGYMLHVSAPALHTWLEVWVQGRGWLPIDLFSWGLTTERAVAGGWRDHFFGRIDHRMVLERPPLLFGGTGDVRLPARWHMLNFAEGKGATSEFREMESGALVYSEQVEVERLDREETAVSTV